MRRFLKHSLVRQLMVAISVRLSWSSTVISIKKSEQIPHSNDLTAFFTLDVDLVGGALAQVLKRRSKKFLSSFEGHLTWSCIVPYGKAGLQSCSYSSHVNTLGQASRSIVNQVPSHL